MSVDTIETTSPVTIEDCKNRIEHLEAMVSELSKAVKKPKPKPIPKPKKARDPVKHSQNQLARYYEKREEINARRRAAYKAKKEAAAGAVTTS
jgi:hypothetical protein